MMDTSRRTYHYAPHGITATQDGPADLHGSVDQQSDDPELVGFSTGKDDA